MIHVVFNPWTGSRYKKENNVRLLLLGESHYGEPDEEPAQATSEASKIGALVNGT